MLKKVLKLIVVYILQWEARLILAKYKPKIIGITGSVGKTSVKDAVHLVLAVKFKARKSEKSYNSELGVPLTIINRRTGWSSPTRWLENILEGLALIIFPHTYPEWLVLEIGADRPGDISKLCRWLKPDLAIITRLPDIPVHIEFFPSSEAWLAEKITLAESVKTGGTVVLNYDDENIRVLISKLKTNIISYGYSRSAGVWASDYHLIYNSTDSADGLGAVSGLTFKLNYQGDSLPIRITGAIGRHHVYTILAAIAVGLSQGLNPVDIAEAITAFKTPPGRMRIIVGLKKTTVIDDSYNAGPAAMEAGLDTLAEIKSTGRKIAVLGDMLELGEYTINVHKTIGRQAADKADMVLVVGLRAKFIAEGLREAGFDMNKVFYFNDSSTAGLKLQEIIMSGDIIYIKGSQAIRMEKTVEEIMLLPEQKEELLCRQEREWQGR